MVANARSIDIIVLEAAEMEELIGVWLCQTSWAGYYVWAEEGGDVQPSTGRNFKPAHKNVQPGSMG
jgi:hypothetical protein